MHKYYIIEHPTRGCLKELDSDVKAGARFALAGFRSDENVEKFYSITAVKSALAKIAPKVREHCFVLAPPSNEQKAKGDYEWKRIQL